jgi:hypothetical protein
MTPAVRQVILGARFNPYALPNNAAIYSLDGPEGDATYLTNGLGKIRLIADRSGNSSVNCFASGGAASNTATSPTKSVTGSQTITADVLFADYTPGTNHTIFSKLSGNDGIEALLLTTGVLRLRIGDGAAITNVDSTVSVPTSDLARATFAAIWTDGVGASFTVNGSALGTAVAAAKTLTNAATTATIGTSVAGCIFRVQVGSVYDFNPSLAAKLAATVVSGGDTWTINSSGDTAAHICGARDLFQGTTAKMPALSVSGGYNIATFDGSNDYMKAAAFSLSQPESVYLVGAQVSWTGSDYLYDGNALNLGILIQRGVSPELQTYAGNFTPTLPGATIGQRFIFTAVFNGASSLSRLNLGTTISGNAGSSNMGGFTLCGDGVGTETSNFDFNEAILRSVADDAATQGKIVSFEIRKWAVPA